MSWFKFGNGESFHPTPEEEDEMRAEVRKQIEELLVGERFRGEFSGGRRWELTVDEFALLDFRMTINSWE